MFPKGLYLSLFKLQCKVVILLYKYYIYIIIDMGKIILTPESLVELQKIIETQLNAMKLAHFDNKEVRRTIGVIIVNQFKKYLKIF